MNPAVKFLILVSLSMAGTLIGFGLVWFFWARKFVQDACDKAVKDVFDPPVRQSPREMAEVFNSFRKESA